MHSGNGIVEKNGIQKEAGCENRQLAPSISPAPLIHAVQAENGAHSYNSVVFPSLKNPPVKFSDAVKGANHLYINGYTQYRFYSQHVLIRFLRTDIVFPFHYFW